MTRFAFAGDRDIATRVLRFLVDTGARPVALLVSETTRASHAVELREISGLQSQNVLVGSEFAGARGKELLEEADLDYVIAVHFPYVVPAEILRIPRVGVVNLHPACLPYNRGWHTASWAILDQTPIGATLHFMDEGVDTGDVVAQVQLEIRPEDTAHTLYQRVLEAELHLFKEAWPLLDSLDPPRRPQRGGGSSHRASDLLTESVQLLDLDSEPLVSDILRRLRALSTNQIDEAAYFEESGIRYRVRLTITPDEA